MNWMHRRPVSSILRDTFCEIPKGLMDGFSNDNLYLGKIKWSIMNDQTINRCCVVAAFFYLLTVKILEKLQQ